MAEFVEYEIWLGTFEGEDFVWKTIKKETNREKAWKFYHDYCLKQMSYTDEELKKIWSSARIDVELRQGKKLLNWCGIYSRMVAKPNEDLDEPEEDEPHQKGKESEE